eukprot:9319597-Lingulodinium_polyedra.AAC.1
MKTPPLQSQDWQMGDCTRAHAKKGTDCTRSHSGETETEKKKKEHRLHPCPPITRHRLHPCGCHELR